MGYTKRIRRKTTSLNKYTNGIHKFLGCIYDSHIYTFLISYLPTAQSLADAFLWVVRLRGGLVHSRFFKNY